MEDISNVPLVSELLHVAAEEINEGRKASKQEFQFTKPAHRRVMNSFFPGELKKHFAGQFNVELLEVEFAILDLEKAKGNRKELEADNHDLVTCAVGIRHVCAEQFLPKSWVKVIAGKDGPFEKALGNYSPDLAEDEAVAVCPRCQDVLCENIKKSNAAIVAGCETCQELDRTGAEGRHNDHATSEENRTVPKLPRFLSGDAAAEAVERRRNAIERSAEWQKRNSERRSTASREQAEDVGKHIKLLAKRSQFVPQLKRGYSAKHGRGNGNDGRDRQNGYHG